MMEQSPGTSQEFSQDMKKVILRLAELLKDKKAQDILVLDLAQLTSITDYFILATVNSSTQSKALVRFIEEYLKEYDIRPLVKNDEYESPWVLLDYNYFIIHLFLKEGREYYQLEKLWSDAPVVYSDEGGLL
jgi:ribosome-associated protein